MTEVLTLPPTSTPENAVVAAKPMLSDMVMTVKELDSLGRATEYIVPIPSSSSFKDWTFYQQIAMLKAGAFKTTPIPQIIFAIAYAERMGLDIMQGDVYPNGEGRLATSNKAKIKLALKTGRITGYECAIKDGPLVPDDNPWPLDNDLICTVTLTVKGFDKPIVKTQRGSEWFMPKNPNWSGRPSHMLELNTFAHACELIHPTDQDPAEGPGEVEASVISNELPPITSILKEGKQ